MSVESPRHRAARRVQEWMDANDLGQEEVAKLLKHSQSWVSRQLLGVGPDIDHLDALARMMSADPGDLVTLRGETGTGSAMTGPVIEPAENPEAPGEEPAVLFPSSFPTSPAHVVLYGFIGTLTETQARNIWQPLLQLIEDAQHPEAAPRVTPKKPKA